MTINFLSLEVLGSNADAASTMVLGPHWRVICRGEPAAEQAPQDEQRGRRRRGGRGGRGGGACVRSRDHSGAAAGEAAAQQLGSTEASDLCNFVPKFNYSL